MHAARLLAPLTCLALLLAACGEKGGGGDAPDAGTVPFAGHDSSAVKILLSEELRAIVEQPEGTTLFTLNPTPIMDGKLSPEKERFHNYGVLGKAAVDDPAEHRRLVEATYAGLAGEDAGPASCFLPRHGLRFVRDGKAVEFVICFECTRVHVYLAGGKHETDMLMGPGVKPVFDAAVKAHGLPLAD